MLFWPIFGNLWCSVVTLVTFSSNLSNCERNTKKPKKIKKIQKNWKISKNPKIYKKSKNPKNPKKSKKFQKIQKLKRNPKIHKKHQKSKKCQNWSITLKIAKNLERSPKKCYPLSFPILEGRNSTKALQSSPFQNPVGGTVTFTKDEQTNRNPCV